MARLRSAKLSSTATTTSTDKCLPRPFEQIPGPKGLPVIGNIWRYLPLIGDYHIDELRANADFNRKKYGNIVREKIHDKLTVLHLFDPDDIETLFRQDGKYPSRRAHIALLKYRLDRPDKFNNGGIIPENGERWLEQRNHFNQSMLSKSKVSSYATQIDEITSKSLTEMSKLFTEGQNVASIDAFEKKLFNRWSLRSTSELFLACNIDTLDEAYIARLLQEIDNTLIATHATELRSQKWVKHPDKCKWYQMLIKAQEFLYEFAEARVNQVIDDHKNNKGSPDSMVHGWLFEDKIDRKDVISFVMDAFEAGIHTTSYTLCFLLYHLARNPKYQDLVMEEIDAKISPDKPINAEDVENLKWLNVCLKETLRMHPVAIGTGRLAMADMIIRDYHIPEGTMIIAHNERIGRDDDIFEDANTFKPDRWDNYRTCPKNQRPSPFAFRPFGLGARSCIGRRIIELEMRMLMARLLQSFRIQETSEITTRTIMVHVIGADFRVTLAKRKKHESR